MSLLSLTALVLPLVHQQGQVEAVTGQKREVELTAPEAQITSENGSKSNRHSQINMVLQFIMVSLFTTNLIRPKHQKNELPLEIHDYIY